MLCFLSVFHKGGSFFRSIRCYVEHDRFCLVVGFSSVVFQLTEIYRPELRIYLNRR